MDLPAIQRQMRADYGPHAIEELYRSPVGRRLSWGPLCGPQMAPVLKKALFGTERAAGFATSGHALLSLLDAGSSGLGAVLSALGSSPDLLRLAARESLRQAGSIASPVRPGVHPGRRQVKYASAHQRHSDRDGDRPTQMLGGDRRQG